MITTLEHVDILDKSDIVSEIIKKSSEMNIYIEKEKALRENKEAQRFGTYHPDYNKIMQTVRSTKRKMDMNEYVAAYKLAERNLQNLLDEVSKYIAGSVSSSIIIPEEGILAASGCASGGCGTGGSCAC